MFLKRICFLTCILIHLNCDYLKVVTANTIFHFDLNFKVNENSFKTSLNIGEEGEEDKVNGTEATSTTASEESPSTLGSPILMDIWSKQAQINATANDKLQATRVAVSQLKNEIVVVAGHSEFIAVKIELMTDYLRNVNVVTATNSADADGVGRHDSAAANRFLILQDYVQLVDDLRAPPTKEEEGGGRERSLDYMVMKLGLEKYKLIELQTQISVEVLQAMETWQTYVKKQLVDVAAV